MAKLPLFPRRAVVRPLAVPWWRGPARRDRDVIVVSRQHGAWYYPLQEPRVGMELARVRTPDDAVAFASRFGLLEDAGRTAVAGDSEARQSFVEFERAADDLRRIYRTLSDVRRGARGDAHAVARLREEASAAYARLLQQVDL